MLFRSCVLSLFIGNCAMPVQNDVQAKVKKPVLNKKKASVKIGKKIKLSVKRGKGFKVQWKSKNKKIATVKKSGKYAAKVTGKKVGKTQIVASLKKGKKRYTLKCQITVTSAAGSAGTSQQPENSKTSAATETPKVTPTPNGVLPPVGQSTATPPAEKTTPPAEKTTPPAEKTTPPAEKTTPPAEKTTPPAEKTTPPAEKTTPPAEKTTPPAEKTTPPAEKTATPPNETFIPTKEPDLTKNMATAAKVKGHASSINASVSQEGAVAEFMQSTKYSQADYQMDTPVSLSKVKSVTFSLEVTGTPDSVSFKLYDSDGAELKNITQYSKKSGTYTIEIPELYQSKTISQFSIMTNSDLGEGVTQTATAVLTSLTFDQAGNTPTPVPTPTKEPTQAPTSTPTSEPTPIPAGKPSLPPSTMEDGEEMILSADTFLTSAALQGDPVYNEDGSVTVSITKLYDGGGIGFYIDPAKIAVDLSHYTKVILDVSADADGPICLNKFSKASFWEGMETISYSDVTTERTQISSDLPNEGIVGLGVRYAAWNASAVADPLTITIHSITLVKDTRDITDAMGYSSLHELAASSGFKMGTVFNTRTATDKKYGELMQHHFNSITAANEMKAYSMLDQAKSKEQYEDETSMPAVNFTNADVVMDYAKNNGLKVRGHVLVWDANMCDWFFRVGYDVNQPYATADVVKERLKNYIEQVLTHFEEKYPGVIYCWDVVNEAVSDAAGEFKEGDDRKIRIKRGEADNRFYEILGDHYVEMSFQYTYEILQKCKEQYPTMSDIKLYYNDFNTFYSAKRDAICNLVNSINSYMPDGSGGYVKLCDGVGMQSYIGGFGHQAGCMNENDIKAVKTAILMFADCGVEVQVTELAVRNYQGDEATLKAHADFYEKLFQAYMEVNQEKTDKPLKAVSIWGIVDRPDMPEDDYSFTMNGTYCGLFDEKLGVKPAFVQVHELLKGGK